MEWYRGMSCANAGPRRQHEASSSSSQVDSCLLGTAGQLLPATCSSACSEDLAPFSSRGWVSSRDPLQARVSFAGRSALCTFPFFIAASAAGGPESDGRTVGRARQHWLTEGAAIRRRKGGAAWLALDDFRERAQTRPSADKAGQVGRRGDPERTRARIEYSAP